MDENYMFVVWVFRGAVLIIDVCNVFSAKRNKHRAKIKQRGERGSNSRPQDHSNSYETYALANCATTPWS